MLNSLWAAFAFLSILLPAKIVSNTCMKNSVFFYPVVGFILGLIYLLVSNLLLFFTGSAALVSTVYLLLSFFLTRGIHHDGLADLADAWGSGARGLKFRQILKDSRIGSFGVIVLMLYFLLSYSSLIQIFELSIENEHYYPLLLLLAPFWGRIGLLVHPAYNQVYIPISTENSKLIEASQDLLNSDSSNLQNKSNLEQIPSSLSQNLTHPKQEARFFLWALGFIFISLFLISMKQLIFILFLSFLSFLAFSKLINRENGYNGDFVGAQCLCYELIAFLSIFTI